MLLASIRRRERVLQAANVLVGLFALFLLLGFQVPLRSPAGPPGPSIRVMTYNLRQGALGIQRIVAVIDKYRPDVLCVQEVGRFEKWGDPVKQIMWLRPNTWHMVRDGELAILSRRPITSSKLTYLPMKTGRAMLAARTSVDGAAVTVCTTHFNTAAGGASLAHRRSSLRGYMHGAALVRLAQTTALTDFADAFKGPVILTGDLNSPPRGVWYSRMTRDHQDAFASAGWGFGYTYRSRLPMMRIDYVFARKPLRVESCFAASDVASDHRAVVADIVLPK
jgi:vancomycin resistance protein VanJ